MRGDCGGCVGIPLSEEVNCVCLTLYLSLYYEVDIVVALCLASKCRGCIVFEREVVYFQLLYCPKSSVEVPCVGSPVWTS